MHTKLNTLCYLLPSLVSYVL